MQCSCPSPPRRKIIFINIVYGLQNCEERYLVFYLGLFVTFSEYFQASVFQIKQNEVLLR